VAFTVLLVACVALAMQRVEPRARAAQLVPGEIKSLAAGKLLVASRDLPDPNFSETVVLLAQVTAEGAMGVIVNRQTTVPLARVLPEFKPPSDAVVFMGGPVEADGVVALARSASPLGDSRSVFGDVYLVTARESLEAQLAAGVGRDRLRVYLGYSGWDRGQLESETLHGAWHVMPGDAAVVFDNEPDSLWEREIKKTEGLLARWSLRPSPAASTDLTVLEVRGSCARSPVASGDVSCTDRFASWRARGAR
jgi:putative transcriptional regulator